MKKRHFVFAFLVVSATLYLAGAFMAMSFDPNKWGQAGRVTYVCATLFISLVIWVELVEKKEDK